MTGHIGSEWATVVLPQGLHEELARWFFQQLIIAVDFCHKKGIANRDIKLEVSKLLPQEGHR